MLSSHAHARNHARTPARTHARQTGREAACKNRQTNRAQMQNDILFTGVGLKLPRDAFNLR